MAKIGTKSGKNVHTSARMQAAGGFGIKYAWAKVPTSKTLVNISCAGVAIQTYDTLEAVLLAKLSGGGLVVKTCGAMSGCTVPSTGKILLGSTPTGFCNCLLQAVWSTNLA